jgi:hypothetical protein
MARLSWAVILLVAAAAAAERRVEVGWDGLEAALANRKVEIVLPDGTHLTGRILSVAEASLSLAVAKTSDSARYSKGTTAIPREQVRTLRYSEASGPWRAIGTAIGAGSGTAGGALALQRFNNEGASGTGGAVLAGMAAAGTAIGYFVGSGADRRDVVVVVSR